MTRLFAHACVAMGFDCLPWAILAVLLFLIELPFTGFYLLPLAAMVLCRRLPVRWMGSLKRRQANSALRRKIPLAWGIHMR